MTTLHPERPPHKALSRGGSLGGTVTDPAVLYAWLVRNLERFIEELEFYEVRAGRLTVCLGHKDAPSTAGQVTLDSQTNRFDLLLDAARTCLRRAYRSGWPASYMQLIAERLRRGGFVQRGLFEPPGETAEAIAIAKRSINEQVGRWAVRSGATLPLKSLYDDPSNFYDICDVRGKMCF